VIEVAKYCAQNDAFAKWFIHFANNPASVAQAKTLPRHSPSGLPIIAKIA